MSPEKMSPNIINDPWWYFFPGEYFVDAYGNKILNAKDRPVPIRVHRTDAGLFIQAFGNNYFTEGPEQFDQIVSRDQPAE